MAESFQQQNRGVILLILDGWGINPAKNGNALAQSHKPNFDYYFTNYPHCSISASGEEVGLTWGEVGNSEVGHYNLGTGRVVWQNLSRINNAIFDNSFFRNAILIQACKNAKKAHKRLHLLGLASTGGVHSHIDHLLALISLIKHNGAPETFLHLFTDGRDSPPKIALTDIKKVEDKLKAAHVGKIASITGRYYALDRDNRWKRTQVAYEAIALGKGEFADSAYTAIQQAYKKDLTDEFILPTVIVNKEQQPLGKIEDGDTLIFFNFREDRMIQLVKTFYDPEFKDFPTKKYTGLQLFSFTKYHRSFNFPVAFPSQPMKNTLPEMIAKSGMHQLHLAETEKYAHVTYFLNGGKEEPLENEDRTVVPSPRVATYDQKPEMSVFEITQKASAAIQTSKYQFIVINFANPDMVGHTGNLPATIKSVEACDTAIRILVDSALKNFYTVLITADHGNAEEMYSEETGQISKDHSTNPVPVILISPFNKKTKTQDIAQEQFLSNQPVGVLADVAPTVLNLLKIKIPKEMTGYPLTNVLI